MKNEKKEKRKKEKETATDRKIGRPFKVYQFFWLSLPLKRLTTGKNEKEYSWHVPAMKFTGKKQLV